MSSAYNALLRRERLVSEQLPYSVHLSPCVLRTGLSDYLQVFRLSGISFESVDDTQLNNWHERLNILWRNIASPEIALWVHVIRRREDTPEQFPPGSGFANALHAKYQRWLGSETLMANELYLSVLYRPVGKAGGSFLSRLLRNHAGNADIREGVDACEKLGHMIAASLARYDPQPLGVYEAQGRRFSSLLEFLGLLLNGERERVPLRAGPASQFLPSTRLFFGSEAVEYRLPAGTRVGAFLGIREYATPSLVGFYNRLLSAPFSFVLTQSFAFLSKPAAQGLLMRQIHRMANAGDFGVTQAAQLTSALDALTGNEFVMGDHHFSLQILVDVALDATTNDSGTRLKPLNDDIARARALLADTGMAVAREDLALEAAFWAQLPGNFSLRPRRASVTSRNFAAMSAFHNFPAGRLQGNHWGDALATLTTTARSPYHFSLHASDPADPDGRRDTGHTLICGPTGCGKTVLVGFLISMLARQGATQIVFDKDRGLEILIRALGGQYFPLRAGIATGFNPLQLAGSPADIEFLKEWLRALCGFHLGDSMSVRQGQELELALQATLTLERGARRLSRLVEFLDPTDPEGLHARLARWCHSRAGADAWVFDNPIDAISGTLSECRTVGFDVTEFLDTPRLRTPLTLYLFYLVRGRLDGRRLVCWMDEFWRLLADEAFAAFAKDGPKTWRKLNGVMCLATQSASDVLQSSISRTIVEQTATKIFFPNADATLSDYTEGFGLTEREFRLIKERLEPGSRCFLIKQGHVSVVARLDLRGFDAEVQVISGRAVQVERLHSLLAVHGPDPARWLPSFMASVNPAGAGDAPLSPRELQ